nr:putative integron gene cassette protein [uncultured bacterium]CAP47717.1 putative integron gene cassette protein [uncultured bacterium]CAP47776.1 putative integron gene cassette protein [uncultured bacterium]CAP47777.1 putative integron gene cassette protein [uncultured bacterium]
MTEGWLDDNYLILFDEHEVQAASDRYRIADWLPGYRVIGLWGWDDLVVCDSLTRVFTVPTVPIDSEYLAPFELPVGPSLKTDPRYTGRVKWYVKPVVFGGDPAIEENISWISLDHHAELVVWWNTRYRQIKNGGKS